ncbi:MULTISPECIES: hypothetical protein [Actinoplanes]|uniref:hypothetical protein n=1 Tax=Actinoplanes TaxID=1865 RepID=UPI0005F2EEFD|nr:MULTISPECIES: hypothetical protein [Actinoplanes]GLY01023.1 hypothetical protein Acsp01_14020 [Actinoplanes sp. NBRC 101535]
MTNRFERLKMQRRMQRRIRLVVEERRVAFAARDASDQAMDPETTIEITPAAIGRVAVPHI